MAIYNVRLGTGQPYEVDAPNRAAAIRMAQQEAADAGTYVAGVELVSGETEATQATGQTLVPTAEGIQAQLGQQTQPVSPTPLYGTIPRLPKEMEMFRSVEDIIDDETGLRDAVSESDSTGIVEIPDSLANTLNLPEGSKFNRETGLITDSNDNPLDEQSGLVKQIIAGEGGGENITVADANLEGLDGEWSGTDYGGSNVQPGMSRIFGTPGAPGGMTGAGTMGEQPLVDEGARGTFADQFDLSEVPGMGRAAFMQGLGRGGLYDQGNRFTPSGYQSYIETLAEPYKNVFDFGQLAGGRLPFGPDRAAQEARAAELGVEVVDTEGEPTFQEGGMSFADFVAQTAPSGMRSSAADIFNVLRSPEVGGATEFGKLVGAPNIYQAQQLGELAKTALRSRMGSGAYNLLGLPGGRDLYDRYSAQFTGQQEAPRFIDFLGQQYGLNQNVKKINADGSMELYSDTGTT
tara:strand:+ start:4054 stop:5439 length:1386 start_codon:yes stop_codon:yes gene_type:complete